MRWLVFLLYVVVISAFLLTPQPVVAAQAVVASADVRFLAAKTFHLLAYALLAVLGGWLGVSRAGRPLLLLVLSLHACGTEFFQQFVALRSGCWQDAALNHMGLYFGLVVSWKWWTSPATVPASGRSE